MSTVHQMDPNHANILRQSIGVKQADLLPPKLEEKYWELKRVFDRTGTLIRPADLAMICFFGGFGKKPTAAEAAPPTIVSLWRSGELKRESRVQVDWRGKKALGIFKGVNARRKVMVQIDGDPDEREFEDELVSVVQDEPIPAQS